MESEKKLNEKQKQILRQSIVEFVKKNAFTDFDLMVIILPYL